jgi:hypothetical protein
MNNSSLSIATMTWARDPDEENLLRKSLKQLATFQLPVFITDGGSNAGFIHFMKSFPNFFVLEASAKGVWAQVKNSLKIAHDSGSAFILYTEPDKYDFFLNGLPQMLDEPFLSDASGVLMACRSAAGFATFPAFQQMTETTINNCCAEIIRDNLDYTYGPFILNRQLVPYLNFVETDIGWGWRLFTFCVAKQLGYKVEAYMEEFSCPVEQRQDSARERIYRMRQMEQSIQGVVLSTTVKLAEQANIVA